MATKGGGLLHAFAHRAPKKVIVLILEQWTWGEIGWNIMEVFWHMSQDFEWQNIKEATTKEAAEIKKMLGTQFQEEPNSWPQHNT